MRSSETTPSVSSWAALGSTLCALLLLSSCAGSPPVEHVVETVRTVEVPVETVRPVPTQLTTPLRYPPPLGEQITVETLIDRLFELYELLDRANADRATVKELTTP